jgi:D-serine deaminase-like pyridoxal phosphate-dependent protein
MKDKMSLRTLKTPCLILEHQRVKANAQRMSQRVHSLGSRLRPHVKTHKCIEVARLQIANNFGGIAVSTLAEAKVFAANGFNDIMYAVPIEPGKFCEAIELSKRCERLLLITDDGEASEKLNDCARKAGVRLNLLLDIDCGYGRCGVCPEAPEALKLVRQIVDSSHLCFAGVLTHAGQSYHARCHDDLLAVARRERDLVAEFACRVRKFGIDVPCTSIGSTPTINTVDHLRGIDEARVGNYIFYDSFQAVLGTCSFEDCAITVLTAVVSRDRGRRQVVFDAGAVALSKDRGPVDMDPGSGYGRVLDLEGNDLGIRIHSVSQEHGLATVNDDALLDRLEVGSRTRIMVNHSCLTAAQHDGYYVLEEGEIVDRWTTQKYW